LVRRKIRVCVRLNSLAISSSPDEGIAPLQLEQQSPSLDITDEAENWIYWLGVSYLDEQISAVTTPSKIMKEIKTNIFV